MGNETDNIEAAPRTQIHTTLDADLKGQTADEGYELFEEAQNESTSYSVEATEAVRRKIDLHLLPLVCILYGLNYVDKVAMGWAVLFNFRDDLGLHGTQYS
ncbi:uncharacterized protein LY89DRAFT_206691 [Mollisia scopiformis]|uniref:Uncharacterized protein n=1 Tax=Mollisia scopiformis TaxID=149040 RepID=A0A194WWS5_MOLSC|nr:uncharacterized protein LY89DRAFT_206691 [Mollisia scopiformis]KUJ12395.1 hypothetical protein LY89DRAFT_206691 [Mollisia scopiformis]